MAKLTKAGALYLQDYYILNEARDEMLKYLDEILSALNSKLFDMKQELTDDLFKWGLWSNQSSPGHMGIYPNLLKGDSNLWRIGKADAFVIYRDVRHSSRIKEPYSVELNVATYGQAKSLRQEIERRSLNMFGSNIIGYHYPSLIPESSDESVEIIFDAAQDLCTKLKKIIDSIVTEEMS